MTDDDGGTRAWRANAATWQAPPRPSFPAWGFLFCMIAVLLLLLFIAAASWLTWTGFQAAFGTQGAVVALAGVAALTMLLRRRTGMGVGKALMFVALAAFAGLVWLVLALFVYALVMGA